MPKLGYVLVAMLAWSAAFAAQPESMLIAKVGDKPVAYHVLGAGTGMPVLTINGGPGFAHDVLHLSSARTAPGLTSHPIVFFDQPGTGRSWSVREGDPLTVSDVLDGMDTAACGRARRQLGAGVVTRRSIHHLSLQPCATGDSVGDRHHLSRYLRDGGGRFERTTADR